MHICFDDGDGDDDDVQGLWSPSESRLHIIFLELRAIGRALDSFSALLISCHALLAKYNMTAVLCKQGGIGSIQLCRGNPKCQWAIEHKVQLMTKYIAGQNFPLTHNF